MRLRVAPVLVLAILAFMRGTAHAQTCAPPLHPRIAEVLYDAIGDDSGREFVELFNPSGVTHSLAGARLEAGDGSGAGRWTLRWTGGMSDSILPGGRFVIGGALLGIPPQALVDLDLQNGPDAVRILWPDGAIERVGYGALEFPEYACGLPAPDVASGQSLARIPDDADGGGNVLDFRAAPPTPGRANQMRRDLGWVAGASRVATPWNGPGSSIAIAATLENHGSELLPAGACAWSIHEAGESASLASGLVEIPLASGETTGVVAQIAEFSAGKRRWVLVAALAGDEGPDNDRDSLWVRIGLGPLQLTEVQFHPTGGEGEWVEVWNGGSEPLDLGLYGFADRAGHPGHSPPAVLAPESLAIFAQDRVALLARFPKLDTTRVLRVSPWPALNNGNDETGVADVAMLVEADGTPSDRLAYSASGIPSGVPLERDRGGQWVASPVAGGTPLEPPRLRAAVIGRFEVEPRRLLTGHTEARLRWDLPWPRARIACELYDLAGRPRGQVLPEMDVSGRGEQRWAPSELSAGLYLMVLKARAGSGDGRLAVTRPIRVDAP